MKAILRVRGGSTVCILGSLASDNAITRDRLYVRRLIRHKSFLMNKIMQYSVLIRSMLTTARLEAFRVSADTEDASIYWSAMDAREEKRWFRTIVLLTVTVTLLLALLIPHPQTHHGTVLATILLLPLFLFGIIERQTASWLPGSLEEPSARPLTCRPSLFQRPPPPLFA